VAGRRSPPASNLRSLDGAEEEQTRDEEERGGDFGHRGERLRLGDCSRIPVDLKDHLRRSERAKDEHEEREGKAGEKRCRDTARGLDRTAEAGLTLERPDLSRGLRRDDDVLAAGTHPPFLPPPGRGFLP
jgi:hypothetical protein